jgi:ParB family chromosome partitioning protein
MRVEEIEIANIIIPPERARATFTQEQHEELLASIQTNGFTVPILVNLNPDGSYTLIDGEHRIAIAKEIGMSRVPAVIVEADEKKFNLLNVLANTARGTQNPMDVAKILAKARDAGASLEEVAAATGHDVRWVKFYVSLNELPEVYQKALHDGRLKVGHVQQALRLWSPEEVDACLSTALQLGWTVDQTKYYVDQRLVRYQVLKAQGERAQAVPPPTIEEAKEIIDYGECFICARKTPRTNLRMPVVCPDCYELSQYVVQQIGTGKEAMQTFYDALSLYYKLTRQAPSIQQQVAQQSQQSNEEQPGSEEEKAIDEIVKRVLEAMKSKGESKDATG